MAKTLIYADGSPTSVKIGDTDTDLYLQVTKDNVAVDLTAVKSITVKIADTNKNYLKDISISSSSLPDGSQGILVLPLNSGNIYGLNSGDYYFEVWIVTADGDSEIYPDMNVTKFHVFDNIVGGTTILTTLTMQAFLDKITTTQNASETVLQTAQAGLQNMNTAYNNANTALNNLKAGNYLTKDTLSSAPSFSALQTQVNNSAVGNNLLLGTSETLQTVTNATGWGGCGYCTTNRTDLTNETYTARAYISPASHDAAIFVTVRKISDGSSTNQLGSAISAGTSGYSKLTYTVPDGYYISQVFISFTSEYSDSTQISWKEMKLEKGSNASGWCLNPAEILTQSDYAKIKAAIVALGGSLS